MSYHGFKDEARVPDALAPGCAGCAAAPVGYYGTAPLGSPRAAGSSTTPLWLLGGALAGGALLYYGAKQKPMRRNEKKTKKVLLAVGVVGTGALVGGVLLWRSRAEAQAPPDGPTVPTSPTPGAPAKAAECQSLQNQLLALKLQIDPDPAQLLRLESQVASCLDELEAEGGTPPADAAQLSVGDENYARIEAWFAEYRATDYGDLLKRNNIRQEMLRAGEAMATAYAEAVTQSTDAVTTAAVWASIVRALDSAMKRRICYLYDERGCGRFGTNEDHGNDKAAQLQSRVIRPLLEANTAAIEKLGGLRSAAGASPAMAEKLVEAYVQVAVASKARADAKFAEYKSVDYSDVLRRNNLRQEVLTAGREATAALRGGGTAASAMQMRALLQLVAPVVVETLDAAIGRWVCYLTDQAGCGRFGTNEDHGNDKAAQVRDAVITPLSDLYMTVGTAMVRGGDVTAFEPFIEAKLRACTALKGFVDSKFDEYKSVEYLDAVRRNNLRQVVLTFGAHLASCLADAQSRAQAAAAARPVVRVAGVEEAEVSRAEREAATRRAPAATRRAPAETPRLRMTAQEARARLRMLTGR